MRNTTVTLSLVLSLSLSLIYSLSLALYVSLFSMRALSPLRFSLGMFFLIVILTSFSLNYVMYGLYRKQICNIQLSVCFSLSLSPHFSISLSLPSVSPLSQVTQNPFPLGSTRSGLKQPREPLTVTASDSQNVQQFLLAYVMDEENFMWNPNQNRTDSWKFFSNVMCLLPLFRVANLM